MAANSASTSPSTQRQRPRPNRQQHLRAEPLSGSDPDALVGEEGDLAVDGLGAQQAHGFRVADLAEEAFAGAEYDRVDLQPQLVDEVVLHQRPHELEAGHDEDVPA